MRNLFCLCGAALLFSVSCKSTQSKQVSSAKEFREASEGLVLITEKEMCPREVLDDVELSKGLESCLIFDGQPMALAKLPKKEVKKWWVIENAKPNTASRVDFVLLGGGDEKKLREYLDSDWEEPSLTLWASSAGEDIELRKFVTSWNSYINTNHPFIPSGSLQAAKQLEKSVVEHKTKANSVLFTGELGLSGTYVRLVQLDGNKKLWEGLDVVWLKKFLGDNKNDTEIQNFCQLNLGGKSVDQALNYLNSYEKARIGVSMGAWGVYNRQALDSLKRFAEKATAVLREDDVPVSGEELDFTLTSR